MIKSKAALLIIAAIAIPIFLNAQINHFIYLQTEGKQPFYAKLDKKVMSSSASGYLIIPKLKSGNYNITVGFPKQEGSEQAYLCVVNDKDAGYLIKNFGDKGWGLFNLQTLDVTMAGGKANTETAKVDKTDEFSSMLSEVTNDPSVKQLEKEAPQEKPITKHEEKLVVKQVAKSTVVKKQTIATNAGVEITYIDITGDKEDTIKIFLPAEEKKQEAVKETPLVEEAMEQPKVKEEKIEEKQAIKEVEKKEDKKFLPIEVKASPAIEPAAQSPVAMVNSDCKAYATDEDFLKLRKKMAGEETDESMIAAAKKFFKSKCYTTEQIKNLSALFLKDTGKYQFFDLAYQYVSDSSKFGTLQSLLTEEYYISRFKAMVNH